MEFDSQMFPLPSFNPMRQKQSIAAHQNFQRPSYASCPGSVGSQVANLKQFISVYFDSIQMVCQAGSWLAEAFSVLMAESATKNVASEMKATFIKMLQFSVSATTQAKNDVASILLELFLPNNAHMQTIRDSQQHNAKVLEKCIHCLSNVHNSLFKIELDIDIRQKCHYKKEGGSATKWFEDEKNGDSGDKFVDYYSEWERLGEVDCNIRSWLALKQRSSKFLRKYNGLNETEIQNLVNHGNVSQLYLQKLNHRIDTALRNYEIGLRSLSTESTTVFGGFYSSPDEARKALNGCCSEKEIEQGSLRLPTTQFLRCELPLMTISINGKEYCSSGQDPLANFNSKKNAIRLILQSSNQRLSISQTDDLSSEILGDVCPARWRTHVKACLQLLFGNTGLVIMDTISSETNTKPNAVIRCKMNFIIVSITSIWCLKEDPGTMSILQRNFDPEKTLATINVRYVSIFNSRAQESNRSQPGVFVETFLQTGSQNRRRFSSLIRDSQTLHGAPLTLMSTCWLTDVPVSHESPILLERSNSVRESVTSAAMKPRESVTKAALRPGFIPCCAENRRRKKLVVEVKEEDSSTEGDKSSDNDDSVRDVIQLLSGSRISARKQNKAIISTNQSDASEHERDGKLNSPVTKHVREEKEHNSIISQKIAIHLPSRIRESQSVSGSFGGSLQHHSECPSLIHQYPKDSSCEANINPFNNSTSIIPTGNGYIFSKSECSPRSQPVGPNLTVVCSDFQKSVKSTVTLSGHQKMELGSSQIANASWLHGTTSRETSVTTNQYVATTDSNHSVCGVGMNAGKSSAGQDLIHQQKLSVRHDIKDEMLPRRCKQMGHLFKDVAETQQNRNNNNVLPTDYMAEQVVLPQYQPHACRSDYLNCGIGECVSKADLEVDQKLEGNQPGIFQAFSLDREDQMHLSPGIRSCDDLLGCFNRSLGPIGSSITKRHSKAEPSVPWQPPPCNTWPFSHDFNSHLQNTAVLGEWEYRQYVAEVTKKACWQKQPSRAFQCQQRITDDVVKDTKCNLELSEDSQVMKVNPDSARTGTWPPWQLWPTGNGSWS